MRPCFVAARVGDRICNREMEAHEGILEHALTERLMLTCSAPNLTMQTESKMRLPILARDKLTPRQKEVYEKHVVRRNYVTGPYDVWIHSPELFEKVSAISNFMRFDCSLPVKLREFGILVTARYWDAQ